MKEQKPATMKREVTKLKRGIEEDKIKRKRENNKILKREIKKIKKGNVKVKQRNLSTI